MAIFFLRSFSSFACRTIFSHSLVYEMNNKKIHCAFSLKMAKNDNSTECRRRDDPCDKIGPFCLGKRL
jgi:hypothetical protein